MKETFKKLDATVSAGANFRFLSLLSFKCFPRDSFTNTGFTIEVEDYRYNKKKNRDIFANRFT